MHTLAPTQLLRTAMKKLLLLSLLVLSGARLAHAAPSEASRPEYITRVESCEAILQEFMANPATAIPPSVLQGARALVIVNQFKAGFFLGIKDGYGVILVKKADGRWSLPVLLAAGELSLGLQVGANAIETVMVITDDQTARLLFNQRFNVGVDAKAVAGPKLAEAEKYNRAMITAPVLVYTKAKGLYAGATVKAGWLQRSDDINFILYQTNYTMPELLYSDWVQPIPEVAPLMHYVQRIAP
ncbi:MAG: lipid-binding SYLF domain-containing protein [Opitutales bacterium]|nr:lipid-binding SYLF domain-containing protein [Opitutales bacterium]